MMEKLSDRADAIVRAMQRKRLEQIAATMRERGFAVEIGPDSVAARGRRLVSRWLADPLLRFAGRMG
jgi:hypothetical protein